MITIQQESAATVEADIVPLMEAHDAAVKHQDFNDWPLDIDIDLYRGLEAKGKLRVFTARDAGVLVGYCTYFIVRSHQRKSLTSLFEDAFYVKPEYRGGGTARRIMKFAEAAAKAECQAVFYHSPEAQPTFGQILERTGYTKYSTTYGRRL